MSSPGKPEPTPARRDEDDPTLAGIAALSPEEREVVLKVVDILRKLQFGTVLLVVQDGKVVQIEMAEKFRLR